MVPSGTSDTEGVAYDPASGNVWIAEEEGKTIKEYNPQAGTEIQSLTIPAVLKRINGNFGFESLTISGDGLTLWTCNEESLTVDGSRSSYSDGTLVRLVKYTRATVRDKFQLAAMYPYKTDKWKYPYDYSSKARCGVADLCALPNGSLLVLERELNFNSTSGWDIYFDGSSASWLGWKLYLVVNPASAMDVKEYDTLKGLAVQPVAKTKLSDAGNGVRITGNFEGICLGPSISNDKVSLLLISDAGDSYSRPQIYPLVLNGLNVRTLSVNRPAPVGEPTIVGQNYRFLNNQKIVVDLLGDGVGEKPYTNRCDLVFASSWALPGHGKQGNGPHVEFNITKDDSLVWSVAHSPNIANTPIYAHDTFEEYAQGTYGSNVRYWSGGGEVVQQSYTPFQGSGKEILKRAAHTKVLDAEDGATRAFPMSQMSNISNHRMDLMVEIHRATEALPDTPDGNPRIAIAADTDGTLKLWHRKGANGKLVATPVWSKIADTSFQNGDWVRVSVEIKNGSSMAFARVRINGKGNMPNNSDWRSVPGGYSSAALNPGSGNGPWFPLRTIDPVSCLSLVGTKVDDFVLATRP